MAIECARFKLPGRSEPSEPKQRRRHGRYALAPAVYGNQDNGCDLECVHQTLDHDDRFPAGVQSQAVEGC